MDNAIQQFELQALQALGIILASALIYLATKGAALFKVQLKASQITLLESAVDKVMTLGVSKAESIISDKGWDHIDSKNAVVNFAINTIGNKFAGTLAANSINLSDPACRQALIDQMERMWPDLVTRLSASPVTPSAPIAPIAPAAVVEPVAASPAG